MNRAGDVGLIGFESAVKRAALMNENGFCGQFALDETANFHLTAIADLALDDRIFLNDRFARHGSRPTIAN